MVIILQHPRNDKRQAGILVGLTVHVLLHLRGIFCKKPENAKNPVRRRGRGGPIWAPGVDNRKKQNMGGTECFTFKDHEIAIKSRVESHFDRIFLR